MTSGKPDSNIPDSIGGDDASAESVTRETDKVDFNNCNPFAPRLVDETADTLVYRCKDSTLNMYEQEMVQRLGLVADFLGVDKKIRITADSLFADPQLPGARSFVINGLNSEEKTGFLDLFYNYPNLTAVTEATREKISDAIGKKRIELGVDVLGVDVPCVDVSNEKNDLKEDTFNIDVKRSIFSRSIAQKVRTLALGVNPNITVMYGLDGETLVIDGFANEAEKETFKDVCRLYKYKR